MSVWNQKLRKSMMAAGVSAALAFSGAAVAQQGGQAAPHGGQQGQMPEMTDEQRQLMEEMRSVQQELQQTQAKLSEMEQQAYENNPELGEKREALQAKIAEKMSSSGYDAEKEFEEMKATMAKYQGGEQQPSEEEVKAFRQQQQEFQQRQQQAFQDEEVQSMAQDLRGEVEQVMKENNPQAKDLFAKMERQAEEMQQLREKAMEMRQGG
ncbi:hypothetical protein LV475_04250 [Guyparkeria hydrothermalis]|uniref:hypothetical protein n=1 Tax=Guyparkeria TaxID=2035712 RepID=UPI0010AB7875|nr:MULTISPECIES: hypothetical protein [Guyparkeria]MCL7750803.1 hypothetical protein [Guyparkeria hydrothermalis]TKA88864.1 hypothetical protein FAZ79_08280 [Guyparkeria sp. SB14A]